MKKTWILLVAGFLLACGLPSVSLLTPEAPPGNMGQMNPTVTKAEVVTDVPVITEAPIIPEWPVSSSGMTRVRLVPGDGALTIQLRAEAIKAAALGQHMFVEFDATW